MSGYRPGPGRRLRRRLLALGCFQLQGYARRRKVYREAASVRFRSKCQPHTLQLQLLTTNPGRPADRRNRPAVFTNRNTNTKGRTMRNRKPLLVTFEIQYDNESADYQADVAVVVQIEPGDPGDTVTPPTAAEYTLSAVEPRVIRTGDYSHIFGSRDNDAERAIATIIENQLRDEFETDERFRADVELEAESAAEAEAEARVETAAAAIAATVPVKPF